MPALNGEAADAALAAAAREATALRSRSTTRSAPQASESGSASRNSSPPIRPQTSPGRSSPRITRAAIRSASSPAPWPDGVVELLEVVDVEHDDGDLLAARRARVSSASCSASCRPRWLSTPVSGSLQREPVDPRLQRLHRAAERVDRAGEHADLVATAPAERRRRACRRPTSGALRESRSTGRTSSSRRTSAPTPITSSSAGAEAGQQHLAASRAERLGALVAA